MTRITVILFSLASLGIARSDKQVCGLSFTTLHWSDALEFWSPTCKWSVNVVPPNPANEEGGASVYVRGSSKRSQFLFRVQRDGKVYWSPNDDGIAFEDMYSSNHYRIKVINSLLDYKNDKTELAIDNLIQQWIQAHLSQGEEINYYLPRFVKWTGNHSAVVSVGVVTVPGSTGSFKPQSVAFEVSVRPLQIVKPLTVEDLRRDYSSSCQMWP